MARDPCRLCRPMCRGSESGRGLEVSGVYRPKKSLEVSGVYRPKKSLEVSEVYRPKIPSHRHTPHGHTHEIQARIEDGKHLEAVGDEMHKKATKLRRQANA